MKTSTTINFIFEEEEITIEGHAIYPELELGISDGSKYTSVVLKEEEARELAEKLILIANQVSKNTYEDGQGN